MKIKGKAFVVKDDIDTDQIIPARYMTTMDPVELAKNVMQDLDPQYPRFLNEDGIIYPEAELSGGEVIIGKTSPPRFLGKLESFSTAANVRTDTSIRLRYNEKGVVEKVIVTESEDGSMLIKVQVRDNKHLDELLHKLLKVKGVLKASRMETI